MNRRDSVLALLAMGAAGQSPAYAQGQPARAPFRIGLIPDQVISIAFVGNRFQDTVNVVVTCHKKPAGLFRQQDHAILRIEQFAHVVRIDNPTRIDGMNHDS